MSNEIKVPADAEVTVCSVSWVIQSRAAEGGHWRTENDNTPGLPGGFEDGARKLLRVYRTSVAPGRECRLVKRTMVCYDEPMEG